MNSCTLLGAGLSKSVENKVMVNDDAQDVRMIRLDDYISARLSLLDKKSIDPLGLTHISLYVKFYVFLES